MAKKKTGGPARQAETGAEEVDLAEVLRREGIVEERIPAVVSLIRAMSDAQAGESVPPPVPIPPPVESDEESRVATAAATVISEGDSTADQARTATAGVEPTALQGIRDQLWAWEPRFFRDSPRASFVGRAIHVRASGRHAPNSSEIYDAIFTANDSLLSQALQSAVETQRQRVTESRMETGRNNAASSKITKNIGRRIKLLAEELGYVEVRKTRIESRYLLIGLGQQVFDEWPNWHARDAIPNPEDAPPTDEPDASTEPT